MLSEESLLEDLPFPVSEPTFFYFTSGRLKTRRNTAFLVLCSLVFSVAQITVGP